MNPYDADLVVASRPFRQNLERWAWFRNRRLTDLPDAEFAEQGALHTYMENVGRLVADRDAVVRQMRRSGRALLAVFVIVAALAFTAGKAIGSGVTISLEPTCSGYSLIIDADNASYGGDIILWGDLLNRFDPEKPSGGVGVGHSRIRFDVVRPAGTYMVGVTIKWYGGAIPASSDSRTVTVPTGGCATTTTSSSTLPPTVPTTVTPTTVTPTTVIPSTSTTVQQTTTTVRRTTTSSSVACPKRIDAPPQAGCEHPTEDAVPPSVPGRVIVPSSSSPTSPTSTPPTTVTVPTTDVIPPTSVVGTSTSLASTGATVERLVWAAAILVIVGVGMWAVISCRPRPIR